MWFYNHDFPEIETLTCLETGVQVVRDANEIWWGRPTFETDVDHDLVLLAEKDAKEKFQGICDALQKKGELVGYAGPVSYPIPGE